jgi:hypothetical protein
LCWFSKGKLIPYFGVYIDVCSQIKTHEWTDEYSWDHATRIRTPVLCLINLCETCTIIKCCPSIRNLRF